MLVALQPDSRLHTRGLQGVKGGGLARSSPRPQCPQLPPIAGMRLMPNDRRLVPKPVVSRCSKLQVHTASELSTSAVATVSHFVLPHTPPNSGPSALFFQRV